MPIYGACMIWKKSQIHLPFLLFVNICTNERAGRIQVMTYATFSKVGVLFWKKLIYFLLCNMEILTRKYDLCESVSSIIYLENVHSQTKNHIGLNSFLLKWTLDFTLLFDDQIFFSSIHLCPSNGIQIWLPSVIQRLFGNYRGTLGILFWKIVAFLKESTAYVFGVQTLLSILVFTENYWLKDLNPKNKSHRFF